MSTCLQEGRVATCVGLKHSDQGNRASLLGCHSAVEAARALGAAALLAEARTPLPRPTPATSRIGVFGPRRGRWTWGPLI